MTKIKGIVALAIIIYVMRRNHIKPFDQHVDEALNVVS